eukprot:gnl/MRDRNA2_/MRDRNA2_106500_c0_seq1.p1 gnl/MRDRNA2_/MRDRNA2_106500_c0~~gnl/MRDRNA2_/MRDRNA2_106500_c0_seq1.p1  ORF type:complete len:786 (-),score=101.26 gnl/MRDRNA2_/MRDRNA2_106500_c0_seq1:290-2560(-)
MAAKLGQKIDALGGSVAVCQRGIWFTTAQAALVILLFIFFGTMYAGEYMFIYFTFFRLGIPFNAITSTIGLTVVWSAHPWVVAGVFILVSRLPVMQLIPGSYPMYGKEHLVLWFYLRLFDKCMGEFSAGGMMGASLLSSTDGSRWTNAIYTWLGAKIGADTVIDIHTGSGYLLFPSLVTIGRGCSLNKGVKIRTFEFKNGKIEVNPVVIGDNVHLGAMATVMPGATIDEGTVVGPRSVVPCGKQVDGNVVGSPLQHDGVAAYAGAEANPLAAAWPLSPGCSSDNEMLTNHPQNETVFASRVMDALMFLGLFCAPLMNFISMIPALAAAFWLYSVLGLLGTILSLPVCTIISDLMTLLSVLIAKPLLVGKLQPGKMPMNTWKYFRYWLFMQLFRSAQVVTLSWCKSPVQWAWMNAMGVKIGLATKCWVAHTATFLPDLTDIGRNGFVGGMAMLGTSVVHNGNVVFNKVKCGDNFMIGQQGYVPPGCTVQDGSVLGAGACPHALKELSRGSVWFGNPAISLNVPTYHAAPPSKALLSVHFCFMILKTVLMKLFDTQVPAFESYWALQLLLSDIHVALYPLCLAAIWFIPVLTVSVFVLCWKWITCGTFRPGEHDMYSIWCCKRDLIVSLRVWPEGQLISLLKGTPWICYWYRALGARVGQHVYMETLTMEETDVNEVQDGAVLMDGSGLDSHTVEGAIWKTDHIKVGRGAVVECNAMVLKGATLSDGAHIGASSTVMANEVVLRGHFIGAPLVADCES